MDNYFSGRLVNRNLLFSLVLEIEAGQRSFVLTGQSVFLEMFERAVNREGQGERRPEELIHDEEQKANQAAQAVCWQVCFLPS